MKNKPLKYIGLAILLLVLYFSKSFLGTHTETSINKKGKEHTSITDHATTSQRKYVDEDFNRNAGKIIYSRHAKCRMNCRHIDENEVKEILASGTLNKQKIKSDAKGKTYPIEGMADGHHLRIVFAPKGEDAIEVVTCIDLDEEWPCDCD